MNVSAIYEPGEKTHKDENFPVASYLIRKRYRPAVMAFYQFARGSDDVADNPHFSPEEKITLLNRYEATLLGESDATQEALPLRDIINTSNLPARHAQDLLIAFRQDALKARYANWDELVDYCMHSAAPVGRFVLDVHGEDRATWPAADALCSALQIINHLQDCKADYKRLNRVYIPQEALGRHGLTEADLAKPKASAALRACIQELTLKTQAMLTPALSPQIRDARLRLEVRVIEKLAHKLIQTLFQKDPLSERVHLTKFQFIFILLKAIFAQGKMRA